MNDSMVQRIGGGAGILFGILSAAAFLTLGDSPDFVDDQETINTFFLDNEGKIFGAALFAMLGAFALAWFANGLREAMSGGDDGAAGPGAGAVIVGAAIAGSAYAISGGILVVGAQRVSEHGEAGAASSFLNYDLFLVVLGGAAPIGLAVLLSGVALFVIRGRGFLPAWLGWVSVVLAIVGLIPPISWALIMGIAVWSILVGVLMLRRPATT